MTQPSGIILACPSKYGFILRSSPIVCVLDTIQLVFSIAKECCLLKSPRAAITKVAVYRFRDANEAEEGSLGKLQKNTTVRWIIFLIGAVPQIIKLYAMSGVPITKMWSSMYLSSFVVIELMVRTLGDEWKNSNVNDPSVVTFMDIDRWSAGRHIAMYLSILITIMAPLLGILFGKSSQIITMALFATIIVSSSLLSCNALTLIVGAAGNYLNNDDQALQLRFILFLLTLGAFYIASGYYVVICGSSLESGWALVMMYPPFLINFGLNIANSFGAVDALDFKWHFLLTAGLSLGITDFLIAWGIDLVPRAISLTQKKALYLSLGMQMQFLFLHLLGGILGYAFMYTEDGTSRPAWTGLLG